jgi:hypothetical protein
MSKNNLFNFIESQIYNGKGKKQSFKNSVLVKSTTLEDKPYFRFDLSLNKIVMLRNEPLELTLTGHHISVYKDQNDNIPVLSQYHYTADFAASDGKSYKLHTYFNDNDELTAPPILSVENAMGQCKPVESESFHEQFLNLASLNIQTVLTELRKQQYQKITALEESINQLEQDATALSANLQDNYEIYQATTDRILEETKTLAPLVKHSNYEKMYNITALLKKHLAIEHAILQRPNEPQADSTPEQKDDIAPLTSHRKKSKHTQKKRQTPAPKVDLEASVTALALRFSELDRENPDTFTTEINELHTDFYQISVLLDEKIRGATLSIDSLKQLQQLEINIKNTGKKLLFDLLDTGSLDLAAKLTPYHYLLNATHLNEALGSRNHQVLDFLLTYGDYGINNQSITISGQTYNSPAHYCVQAYTKKSSTKDCLSVLIRHGASILATAKNGLPIAHTILSTVNHPLRIALSENTDKTTQNPRFYQQLTVALEYHLRTCECSDEMKKHLEQWMEYYTDEASQASALPQWSGAHTALIQGQMEDFKNHIDDELRQHVLNEPKIKLLKQQIDSEAEKYLNKLNAAQKRLQARNLADELKAWNESLIRRSYDKSLFGKITQQVIINLEDKLLYLKKTNTLLDIQQDIKSYQSLGKISKQQRKRLAQQTTLTTEISALEEKINILPELKLQSELQNTCSTTRDVLNILSELRKLIKESIEQKTSEADSTQDDPSATVNYEEADPYRYRAPQFGSLFHHNATPSEDRVFDDELPNDDLNSPSGEKPAEREEKLASDSILQ